jgi:aquaporin Z
VLFGHAIAAASTGSSPLIMLAEFLGTFALVYTVLNVATSAGTSGNSFYGLASGFIVFVQAVALGAISGGAFNPAVAIGASVMGAVKAGSLWMYWLSELLAAAAAAGVFRFITLEHPVTNQAGDRSHAPQAARAA